MIELHFSFVIPVYNRPNEIDELLQSLVQVEGNFEVVIVEDGSDETCDAIVDKFKEDLDISYFLKENSGPGDSRNFGMSKAKGNYFIILDSDVIVPSFYLKTVREALHFKYLDCYGGSDKALDSFTSVQKAIDYAMTSILTTGGIRGTVQSKVSRSYEPRSFNMGISKSAYKKSGGFGKIHPGEDPDLSIRLRELGFKVGFIHGAHVYHKRRTDLIKFSRQIFKFGLVRPILLERYPSTSKPTYWFPFYYTLGLLIGIGLLFIQLHFILYFYVLYNSLIMLDSLINYKSIKISFLSLLATNIQFLSYGIGFIISYYKIHILKKNPKKTFPKLFFN
ncbi:glycosyltransferase [Psychroflexus tropicus]|uniref:glycosyltransferase n=1 Tax=Psychroflexus tropicus TaxID=197345 RepID=UPI0003686AA9|nr:glycosyltransferase [Psychroflexus tropicus]